MNTLTQDTAKVNTTILDDATDDAEWSAWLEANADRMADESEANDRVESGYWAF